MSQLGITIQLDESQERKLKRQLRRVGDRSPRVLARSINKTATKGRTLISQKVRGEITLKARSAKKRINVTRRASPAQLGATIGVSRSRFPSLSSFSGVRETKTKGVTVKVRRNEPKESFPRSFLATAGGVRQVFVREAKKGGVPESSDTPLVGRKPIARRIGPSVLGVFTGKPGLQAEVEQELDGELLKKTRQQVNFELIRQSR